MIVWLYSRQFAICTAILCDLQGYVLAYVQLHTYVIHCNWCFSMSVAICAASLFWLQDYVSRLAGLLQLSNGNQHSQAGKQVEVTHSLHWSWSLVQFSMYPCSQCFWAESSHCIWDFWTLVLDLHAYSVLELQCTDVWLTCIQTWTAGVISSPITHPSDQWLSVLMGNSSTPPIALSYCKLHPEQNYFPQLLSFCGVHTSCCSYPSRSTSQCGLHFSNWFSNWFSNCESLVFPCVRCKSKTSRPL